MSSTAQNQDEPFDPDTCGFAVFATQGGGLARIQGETYVFVEAPEDIPELRVGDAVPKEWGVVGINAEARELDDPEFEYDLPLDPAGTPGYF